MALPRTPIQIPGKQINDLRLALNDVLLAVKNGSSYVGAADFFPLADPSTGKLDSSWLNFAQMEASDLVWTPNNDGSGSGLDADLLRGQPPAAGAATANSIAQRTATGQVKGANPLVGADLVTLDHFNTNAALLGSAIARSTILDFTTSVIYGWTVDTPPLQSAGKEYLTVSYTPKSASSWLRVKFWCPTAAIDGSQALTIALFRDGASAAFGASSFYHTDTHTQEVYCEGLIYSGSLSATTFKVRYGSSGGAIARMNMRNSSGIHLYGAAGVAILTVEEIIIGFPALGQSFGGVSGTHNNAATNTNGSILIPEGSTSLIVRCWGGGGSGACSDSSFRATGGGGGAAVKKTVSISPADWGQTINYVIGGGGGQRGPTDLTQPGIAGSATTVSYTGSFSLAISAGGGTGGTNNQSIGGDGGIASGGDSNVNGTDAGDFNGSPGGASGVMDGIQGAGGTGGNQGHGNYPGGGGSSAPASSGNFSGNGAAGRLDFIWG